MRSLFLSTSTNETDKYAESLRSLDFGQVDIVRYDPPEVTDSGLLSTVREYRPDFICYIGSRWGKTIGQAYLAEMSRNIAPMVHLCSDAADQPWFDLLREYQMNACFTLQVAIDGSNRWPLADQGMTLLTPVDPGFFQNAERPHERRAMRCGYAGNAGGGPASRRSILLAELLKLRAIEFRPRTNLPYTYEGYCDFLQQCVCSVNIAYSGTESTLQVKGRVIETALAGAVLLETRGTPTSNWFTAGEDYLEYDSAEHIVELTRELNSDFSLSQAMAQRLRAKVLADHTPRNFWLRIFQRIGVHP